MTTQQQRLHEVDLLRGIACLSVLAFHYLFLGPKMGWMQGFEYDFTDSIARYGYLGVHLFFLISGFVILMSTQDATPRSFFISRVARLYPTLWIGATLTASAAWILGDTGFTVSIRDYLVNLTMLAHWFKTPFVDGAYWSLAYELHFYIFVWLALRFGLMKNLQWLLVGWLLISAVNAMRPMWPVEFWLNAKWAPFFIAGGVFYLIRTRGITPARLGLLSASFALALIYALLDGHRQNQSAGNEFIQLPVIAAVITAIFLVFWLIAVNRFQVPKSPLVYYAGALTYPLYVIHQNLGYMLFKQLHQAWGSTLIALAIMTTAIFCLSWAVHVIIERPAGKLLRNALNKRYQINFFTSFGGR